MSVAAAAAAARASFLALAAGGERGAPGAGHGGHAHSDGYKHSFHNELGLDLSTYALVLGLASGLSLPLGAALGIKLSPVDDRVCAAMMAFGAGALLFAVTVELYGNALRELHSGQMGILQLVVTISFALLGALFYLFTNRQLEKMFDQEPIEEDEEAEVEEEEGSSAWSGFSTPPTPLVAPVRRQSSLPPDYGSVAAWTTSPRTSPQLLATPTPPRRQTSLPPDYGSVQTLTSTPPPSGPLDAPRTGPPAGPGELVIPPMHSLELFKDALMTQHTPRSGRAKSLFKLLPKKRKKKKAAQEVAKVEVPMLEDVEESPSRAPEPPSMPSEEPTPRGIECCVSSCAAQDTARLEEARKVEELVMLKARATASALFLGLLIDGIPEGILMGLLAAEGHLTPVLVISLFVANFPEAFSSASLLVLGKMPVYVIVGMWTMLCILVGCLTGLSCKLLLAAYPSYASNPELPLSMMFFVAAIEGLTGGAMMACISSVMLPEAFQRAGEDGPLLMSSGFLCTCGFLLAVYLKAALG